RRPKGGWPPTSKRWKPTSSAREAPPASRATGLGARSWPGASRALEVGFHRFDVGGQPPFGRRERRVFRSGAPPRRGERVVQPLVVHIGQSTRQVVARHPMLGH